MVKGILGIFISFLVLAIFCNPVWGENIPVVVTAAEVSYDDYSEQIEATGNVEIKYKDVTVKSNTALLDQKLKMLLAIGDVTVTQGEDTFEGERFIYDIRSEQGWMNPLRTEIDDASFNGSAFFSADLGMFHDDDLFLKHSKFTSCDLADPHYHLTAEKLEYFPDDRLVLHNVWYWEGKHRLFYLPYLFISLKEDKESPFEVEAGHQSDTGWFLYLGYRFYLNQQNNGLLYTKITEWGGDGLGFKNTTKLSSTSKWYQDFYYLNNSDNDEIYDEYKLAFGYENWKNPKFKIKTDVEHWYTEDLIGTNQSKIDLNLQGLSPYPTVSLSYENDDDEDETFNFGENWNYKTKSGLNISTNGSLYTSDYENGSFTTSYRYYLNILKEWGFSNLALKVSNSRIYSDSNSSNQNYLPEITFNIPRWNLPWIGEVAYNGQYTNYQSVSISDNVITNETKGERLASNFTKSKTLWQNQNLRVYTDSKINYRYYIVNKVSSDFTGYIEALNLQKTFWPGLSTTLGINYTITDGAVPSLFVSAYSDYFTEGGSLTNSWALNWKKFNANLSGGFNFTQNMANPVNLSLNWNPGASGSFSFTTVAYLQDNSYYKAGLGMTSLTVKYRPKESWQINLGLNYDFQDVSWNERYFESFITQQVSENWKVRLSARYSDVVGDFSVLNFDLTYDWHCREIVFSYDYIEAMYMVALNFKAFPQVSLSTDMDPARLLYQ